MMIASALLFAALSRAEVIERFKAEPASMASGMVMVYANGCPSAVRRSHQMPIAAAAARICRDLYRARKMPMRDFAVAPISIYLGDATGGVTNVVVRPRQSGGVTNSIAIYLPDPAASDVVAFRNAVVRGFSLAIDAKDLTDDEARSSYLATDSDLVAADREAEIGDWRSRGRLRPGRTDEDMIRMMATVLRPGAFTATDAEIFRSRLWLYPEAFALPFATSHWGCSFAEAIDLAPADEAVRAAAAAKAQSLILRSTGHGRRLEAAALAYAAFLSSLAEGGKSPEELRKLLALADEILRGVTP